MALKDPLVSCRILRLVSLKVIKIEEVNVIYKMTIKQSPPINSHRIKAKFSQAENVYMWMFKSNRERGAMGLNQRTKTPWN